jgi:hypothetical protein
VGEGCREATHGERVEWLRGSAEAAAHLRLDLQRRQLRRVVAPHGVVALQVVVLRLHVAQVDEPGCGCNEAVRGLLGER